MILLESDYAAAREALQKHPHLQDRFPKKTLEVLAGFHAQPNVSCW